MPVKKKKESNTAKDGRGVVTVRTPRPGTAIQQQIEIALEQASITKYWLAKQVGTQPGHVYQKFGRSIHTDALERMLAALGACIQVGNTVLTLELVDGAVRAEFVVGNDLD